MNKQPEVAPLLRPNKKKNSQAEEVKDQFLSKDVEEQKEHAPVSPLRWRLGIAYMFAMGVCGIVLVAIGSTLEDLAEALDTTSVSLGSVFIARGLGAICGAIFSSKLYFWFYGNSVMVVALGVLAFLLFTLPFVPSIWLLHVHFLCLGLGTAVVDTGCQIMTRKIHGKEAGPWLGANTVAFGISGSLVPILEFISSSLVVQYTILMLVSIGVGVSLFFSPNPESSHPDAGKPHTQLVKPKHNEVPVPHYRVEWAIAVMVFWLIGGKVTATSYLDEYVEDTGVMPYSNASLLIAVLWTAITVGRLVGLKDQMDITTPRLYKHIYIFLIGGVLTMITMAMFTGSAMVLWVTVGFYGFFNGPVVGYCYDLNNRITIATEKSMSIVMFGLNFGASLVPYFMSLVWDVWGPKTLVAVVLLSMFIPIPFLALTKEVAYDVKLTKARAKMGRGGDGSSAKKRPVQDGGGYEALGTRDLDEEESDYNNGKKDYPESNSNQFQGDAEQGKVDHQEKTRIRTTL